MFPRAFQHVRFALLVLVLILLVGTSADAARAASRYAKSRAPAYVIVDGAAAADSSLLIPEGADHIVHPLPVATGEDVQLFREWMTKYGKTYVSPDLQSYHLNVFVQNRKFVNAHNARADAGLVSYRVKLNAFADLSSDEWAERVKLLAPVVPYPNRAAISDLAEAKISEKDLPTEVDWRVQNMVSAVKDQGACVGASWAFSAIGAVEGANALRSGKVTPLSEQLLVDCAARTVSQDVCKTGGIASLGIEYLAAHGGAMTLSAYPYSGESFGVCKFDRGQVATPVSAWRRVAVGDEVDLARAVAAHPAVSVSIDARSRGFQFYAEGVYEEEDSGACASDPNELNHAAVVVGYGTSAKNDTPYWIVKNSWGAQWGMDGYVWMRKSAQGELLNHCGIASNAIYVE